MEKGKFHFYAFISRMKYINRWGLMRNTFPENIQEHSLQVAVIAHALAVIRNKAFGGDVNADKITVRAIFHDSNETITGDMPTPIKYFNPSIKQAYKAVEEVSKTKLVSMLPDDIKDVYSELFFYTDKDKECEAIIKAADRISAYIKCIEEEKAGNREFKKASELIYERIMQIDMPEVGYFMEKFMPSFFLSLDELD
jgi:5'-deoxynucleotidase